MPQHPLHKRFRQYAPAALHPFHLTDRDFELPTNVRIRAVASATDFTPPVELEGRVMPRLPRGTPPASASLARPFSARHDVIDRHEHIFTARRSVLERTFSGKWRRPISTPGVVVGIRHR